MKDLRVLGQRKLSDLILVDNAIYSYYFNMDNGVPIVPFYEDSTDNQLMQLIPFLKMLVNVKDVRPVLKKAFQTYQIHNFDEIEKLADHFLKSSPKYSHVIK